MAKNAVQNLAPDPYRYFRPEARNLLDQFAQGVLDLEKGSNAAAVSRLMRLAHTLKGAARVVRQSEIAERAHAIEDTLTPFRDNAESIARENIDTILAYLDDISARLLGLAPGESRQPGTPGDEAARAGAVGETAASGPVKTASGAGMAAEMPRVIRADVAEMDAVLDGISEARTHLNGVRRCAGAIEQVGHLADWLHTQLIAQGPASASGEPVRTRSSGPNAAVAIAEELHRRVGTLARDFNTSVAQIDRELRQLRDAAEGLRLVAVDTVLMALKRTVRDAARSLGKEVNFTATGGDIRLDADVLGVVQGALIQIVRNAVAHGIETPGERQAAGKPEAGRITVDVSRRGGKIRVECRDDGRGIDLAAVRRVAQERGLLSAAATNITAEQLVRMLLRGGISTSAAVTDVSGRGVGLDVVREALDQLGGEVAVHIEPGEGTTFELVIPRSVTAIDALLVTARKGGDAIAIPLDGVRATRRLRADDIARASAGASILHERTAIPFIPLATALHGANWLAGRACTAIIVAGAQGTAAIGIERLVGTAKVVVRPLPAGLAVSASVAGAALDGDGNPQLVLDSDALVSLAQGVHIAQEPEPVRARRPVLVVDDSLTTRMLEKSILESAGYDVDVASSGEEGLDLVRRKPFALILCDVDMPGIDGFTFVERIRSDPALRQIPAILVSSRAAPEDRQRGRDAGAHGYIVKSEFNQAELLTMIGPMVG